MTKRAGLDLSLVLFFIALSTPLAIGGERDLELLVAEYFRAPAERKSGVVRRIEELAGGNAAVVAAAVRSAPLWEPLATRGTWTTELSRQRSVQIVYRLPENYDPTHFWPVVLCMPGRDSAAADVLRDCERFVPGALEIVRIVPTRAVGGDFTVDDLTAAGDLRTLLIEIRRRIHTDTRRTYLFGKADGGDAAWIAMLTQPEIFAHATVVSAYPPLPCLEHSLPLLSENLRNIRPAADALAGGVPQGNVLTMVNAADDASRGSTTDDRMRNGLVQTVSQAFAAYARDADLPVERRIDGAHAVTDRQLGTLTEKLSYPDELSLWFRYPALGRIGWLRQTRWEGPVWEAEAISIRPAPASDRNGFITDVLKAQLGYLGGRKVGQTLHIESRRCAEVELRVPESWDHSRPFTVFINGRKRFEGRVEPQIDTLLESAAESWDTQNLIVATRRFRVSPP